MKFTKTDEVIAKRGRSKAANPFDNDEAVALFIGGGTIRIDLEVDDKGNVTEKPHAVVNQLREVADKHNCKVSVALDQGTAKLTDAKSFRVKWVVRVADTAAPAAAPAAAPVAAPAATSGGRRGK